MQFIQILNIKVYNNYFFLEHRERSNIVNIFFYIHLFMRKINRIKLEYILKKEINKFFCLRKIFDILYVLDLNLAAKIIIYLLCKV